jgi:hypothetical protein
MKNGKMRTMMTSARMMTADARIHIGTSFHRVRWTLNVWMLAVWFHANEMSLLWHLMSTRMMRTMMMRMLQLPCYHAQLVHHHWLRSSPHASRQGRVPHRTLLTWVRAETYRRWPALCGRPQSRRRLRRDAVAALVSDGVRRALHTRSGRQGWLGTESTSSQRRVVVADEEGRAH